MKAVILAGGFGSRLSEETAVRPKPMVEIGGKPMLWHIMKHYGHFGFKEFFVALGYKGEVIKRFFLDHHTLSGDLTVDIVRQHAFRAGRRLDLTAKEFLLLSLFVRRTGEVLSRAMIAEQVWDMNFDPGTNVVDVHVGRLRAKVDDPFERKLIRTVRGRGYVLE